MQLNTYRSGSNHPANVTFSPMFLAESAPHVCVRAGYGAVEVLAHYAHWMCGCAHHRAHEKRAASSVDGAIASRAWTEEEKWIIIDFRVFW